MMDATDIISRLVSHALTLGIFDAVNGHEPKASPGVGVHGAVWVQSIAPVRSSGLSSTSARVEFSVRVYMSMTSEPQDWIDPAIVHAVDVLIREYSGDFTLDGTIRNVDLLGQAGVPLSAQAGYLSIDNHLYRVMTITVPTIINDVYEQTA